MQGNLEKPTLSAQPQNNQPRIFSPNLANYYKSNNVISCNARCTLALRNRPHQPNHRITKLALALSLHLANCNKKVHHIIRNPSKGFLESLGIFQFDLENLPTFRPIQRKTKMVVFFLSSISARCISALRNPRRPHKISYHTKFYCKAHLALWNLFLAQQ